MNKPSDFRYKLLIREFHLDSYGHVNNATYLALLEEARWEYCTQMGFGFQKVHQTGQGPVILEINIKFLRELKLREMITMTLELASHDEKVSRLVQKIMTEKGEVACEATVVTGFFDLKARKLIPPSDEWKKVLGI